MRECKQCALGRDAGLFDDSSCLVKAEFEFIKDIAKKQLGLSATGSTMAQLYQSLREKFKCPEQNGDECMRSKLLDKIKDMETHQRLQQIYHAALPISMNIPSSTEWLTNYMIDDICLQIELNSKQHYFYMGCLCYDAFEDCVGGGTASED